jgi:hypothetical protein
LFWHAGSLTVSAVHLTNEPDNVILDIVLIFKHVQSNPISDVVAQEGELARLSHNVLNHSMLASYYKIAILEEGQSLNYPILGFVSLVIIPLFWSEETVGVRQLKVLAKQSTYLCLRTHSKVAYYHAVL